MKPTPVYSRLPLELVRAQGCTVWDSEGRAFLDLYGGHAVISIGHGHALWVDAITAQASTMAYYSNSVLMGLQDQAAAALGRVSSHDTYDVFFVNSGAEANENAMKLASFATGRSRIIAFDGAFHGRTSLAVAATDDAKIQAPINRTSQVVHVPLNDIEAVRTELSKGDVAAVIIEGIQGVGGCRMPEDNFLQALDEACKRSGALLILDEIQSGCGRTGAYFAFDHAGIEPALITMAKGIGNGFPVGAVLIHPSVDVQVGMLGTTFGGSYMACAAVKTVAEVLEAEKLMNNAEERGRQIRSGLRDISAVVDVRGRGLMLGIVLDRPCADVRTTLWKEHAILTGNSSDPNVMRILPPLSITEQDIETFIQAMKTVLEEDLS